MSYELLGGVSIVAAACVWVVTLMIDNRVLKQQVHDLEKENDRLKDYAKISKP